MCDIDKIISAIKERIEECKRIGEVFEMPASMDCAAPAHVDHVIGTRMHFASVYCINTTISIKRNVFQIALERDSGGVVQMCACESGQAAQERHDRNINGGVYSTLLLKGALQWKRTASDDSVYYTDMAHRFAATVIHRYAARQTPQYLSPDIRHPFAVN